MWPLENFKSHMWLTLYFYRTVPVYVANHFDANKMWSPFCCHVWTWLHRRVERPFLSAQMGCSLDSFVAHCFAIFEVHSHPCSGWFCALRVGLAILLQLRVLNFKREAGPPAPRVRTRNRTSDFWVPCPCLLDINWILLMEMLFVFLCQW